jgi:acetolactate synthase-1/2/3 large subunit
MSKQTGAQALVTQLAARGVKRIFGVPGGDCSLDIIAAAQDAGIGFIVARTENSAAMMAAAGAELNGGIGVVLTTRGPGLANGVNGVAAASLDKTPLVLIGDGYENDQAFISHQRFDQVEVLRPLVKGSMRLDAPATLPAAGALLDLALANPPGPVYIEVTGNAMRAQVDGAAIAVQPLQPSLPVHLPATLEAARDLLRGATRPVIIAGLQARGERDAHALRDLAARLQCPVFATYKSKGILPDSDPAMTGSFIGGAAEDIVLREADLIVFYGADPVEFPPSPWRHGMKTLELATHPFPRHYFVPTLAVVGDLGEAARHLARDAVRSQWSESELAHAKEHMRSCARARGAGPIDPQTAAEAAMAALPADARITVDAGAHMMPILGVYQARRTRDVLISRGLATMAYALPAAIGAALAEPTRPVVAFTGDGGLMMCASELATAVQAGCKITVVVFNDSDMALIDVKQRRRQLAKAGVSYSSTDFAQVARGYGAFGVRVEQPGGLAAAFEQAYAHPLPAVVDVVINPESYHDQIRALRG